MYFLDGGPRHGQLVDAVPAGYLPGDHLNEESVVFGDFVAGRAVWSMPDEPHLWPWLTGHRARDASD